MADILAAFDAAHQASNPLRAVRLSESPTAILAFTTDADEADLHFERDPTVNAYVLCPGTGCPLCHLAQQPEHFQLLPVVNIERRAVEVLRISMKRGPGTLAAGLLPHLRDPHIDEKYFVITRSGAVHAVVARPLGERADRCVDVIQAFRSGREGGLSLLTAFHSYSAEDLAEVPRVRRLLDADDGWSPPGPSGGA
jgi:hypothetical protein